MTRILLPLKVNDEELRMIEEWIKIALVKDPNGEKLRLRVQKW